MCSNYCIRCGKIDVKPSYDGSIFIGGKQGTFAALCSDCLKGAIRTAKTEKVLRKAKWVKSWLFLHLTSEGQAELKEIRALINRANKR